MRRRASVFVAAFVLGAGAHHVTAIFLATLG
jgi:hypothetical protein